MRRDPSLPPAVTTTGNWDINPQTGLPDPSLDRLTYHRGPDYHRQHYSGNERNKLFLNHSGTSFVDLSPASGADSIADSRSWAAVDYDRDGFPDIALVNANSPLLELLHNDAPTLTNTPNHSLAVRLIGANHTASPNPKNSPRTPYGATVTATLPDRTTVTRTLDGGSGFAAHPSTTLLLGLGQHPGATSLTVTFPSGQTRTLTNIQSGTVITIPEHRTHGSQTAPYTP